jgi:hypothetical protein
MITLTNTIPQTELSAESVKLGCLYDSYSNDDSVLFWVQDEGKAVISMTDGNMIIHNKSADLEELKTFVEVLNPACVFSDMETLKAINKTPDENINVMYRKADIVGETATELKSDTLSSKEIYDLLDVKGLSLPEYPYFAVDYCKRLNHGFANYFAIKEKCGQATNEQCARCHSTKCASASAIGCILRLFEKFEGYTPQPHQGHEFGDVAMLVNLRGTNMTLCAAAKSVPTVKQNRKITKSSKLGREIIQQVLDAFTDQRAEIIGVIYPYLLDDQLKHFLYYHAKVNNKRIVILDYEFMCKLLDKYIEDNQLPM